MLTIDQMSRITKEIMLGLPPSLTTAEAREHRSQVEEELIQMRKDGIMPDLPYDFDDLPSLASNPIPSESDIQLRKTTLIRSNLESQWRLAQQLIPIALIFSFLYLNTPAWADDQAGAEAFERGDYATALRELRPLAKHGDGLAQSMLGWMYEWGEGVPKDYVQARLWYEKAAAQGFAPAQTNLGALYNNGRGVPQDYVQARLWYEKAAAQGFADAQFSLGLMYAKGKGVPQNHVQAHMWYNLAAANGEENGTKWRDFVARMMTPVQIAEAQKRAREWKPQRRLKDQGRVF
jgi:TPR repeat protein